MSTLLSWGLVAILLLLLAYYASRMSDEDDGSIHDMGQALMDFGRAFPREAIRSLHFTADGNAAFVRTHDNRAGFMRRIKGHFACRMIEPGTLRIEALANGRGFRLEFTDATPYRGIFEFASAREAAEVSLWLLDNHIPADERAAGEAPVQSA